MAISPLRIPPFGRLLASYTVNQLGDAVGLVALALLVYAQTRDPLATTALFVAAQFLPAFLAPALTARVDQVALRRALPAIYLAEALLFSGQALLADAFLLPAVLLLALLDGVLMLTARGLIRGAVSTVLSPRGLLRQGNGLINVSFAVSGVAGAALGGLAVDMLGVAGALWINAGSFALVALALATSSRLPAADASGEPVLARLREGVGFVRADRLLRFLVSGEALAITLFSLIVPIEVVYAKETLGTSDVGYGVLLAAWGAGAVLGSLVYLRISHDHPLRLIALSTLAIGAAYLGMAAVGSLALACAFSVLGGLGNGIQWVSVMTAVQESTPRYLQARVSGLLESAASVATGVGFILGGVVVALASPPAAFAGAGAGVLLLVALGLTRLRAAGASGPASEAATPPRPPAAPSGAGASARR